MKKWIFLSIFLTLSFTGWSQKLADLVHNEPYKFGEIQNIASGYFGDKFQENDSLPTYSLRTYSGPDGLVEFQKIDGEYAKYKRWEWYWRDRLMPDSTFPDLVSIYRNGGTNPNLREGPNQYSVLQWNNINQTQSTGGYNGMGRVTSIAFHPTNDNIFYVGAPVGGIWKTTNGGQTYVQLGDELPYVSVGNICVDHQNPDIIYISIGDHVGWWNYSLGVYKTTDGGQTWTQTGFSNKFEDGLAIYKMEMSPTNSQVLMVASSKGLFRTADGGTTWQKVRDGEHKDVKFKPGNGNVVYAAYCDWWTTSEVYKSTNAGVTFSKKTNLNSSNNSLILAVTPADPNVVAFLTRSDKAFYLSTNEGESFTFKSNVEETEVIYASPNDPTTFYCGYVNIYQSTNSGSDWNQITIWHGSNQYDEVHADQHFVTHSPVNKNVFFGNDGGVYKYNESSKDWTEYSNGLIITQFYRIAVAQSDPVIMIGGTQDNGGRKRRANGTWTATNGGDAMEVAIDPTNANVLYTTYTNGTLYRSLDGWTGDTYHNISNNIPGQPSGDWVMPYVIDPNDHNTLVAGYQDVFRSSDRGDNWEQLSTNLTGSADTKLQAIAVAKGNPGVLYASNGTRIYYTSNNGQNWASYNFTNSDRITSIAVHPQNPQEVYVTFAGYRTGKKVSVSYNGGQTWSNFSGTLPNVPANSLTFDEAGGNAMYVGTDFGVYYREYGGDDWDEYGAGLPNTNVTDLEIQKSTGMLRIATYGRGVWEIPLWSKAAVLKEPDPVPDNLMAGAHYVYYEGTWTELPDFSALKAVKVTKGGQAEGIDFSSIDYREDDFAIQFDCWVYAPEDGQYTFYCSSDDGSKLYLGDALLINHDGVHGQTEMNGTIGLKQGYHKLKVEYFQGYFGKGLNLDWEGPSFVRRNTSADIYTEDPQQEIPSTFSALSYSNMFGLHANPANTLMGWTEAGDSLAYLLNNNEEGFYKVSLSYASPNDNRMLDFNLDNDTLGQLNLSSSGGYGIQKDQVLGVFYLESGIHTLSIINQSNAFDSYSLKIEKTDCYGDADGSAFLDLCGKCVGGSTGADPCVITGVDLGKRNMEKVYPNPFTYELNIAHSWAETYDIYTIEGQWIASGKITNQNIKPEIQKGTYILKISNEEGKSESLMIWKN